MNTKSIPSFLALTVWLAALPAASVGAGRPPAREHPMAALRVTSLTNVDVKYSVANQHHVVLRRGPVTAVVVDNEAVDVPDCPGHRAGYNGVAVLKHAKRDANLFVPFYAGLNLEHIHGGGELVEFFEPRKSPMELRVVDGHTVELYQAPTPHTKVESCGRYHLLEDGTIEYTFECVAREENKAALPHGYLGFFWASYIHQPESTAIHFSALEARGVGLRPPFWVEGISPKHGERAAHPPAGPLRDLKHPDDFPIVLAFNRSTLIHVDSWYYGVSHGMAWAQMFRPQDRVWFAQSPSGGGDGNPAWDFQWFVPDFKVGEAYGFVMRAAYVPFESREQVEEATKAHREAWKSKPRSGERK
jgi:hypothetical protein